MSSKKRIVRRTFIITCYDINFSIHNYYFKHLNKIASGFSCVLELETRENGLKWMKLFVSRNNKMSFDG